MTYYRPRMAAVLECPLWGTSSERAKQAESEDVVRVPIKVSRATWTRNDHNHADELSLTVDYRDAGVDPRLLGNATVAFYLGNADDLGRWEPNESTRRFLGIVTEVERSNDEDSRTVTIKALDFTSLLLSSKPYPPEGIPKYSQNLEDAWNLIVDHAGGKDTQGNWFRSVELLRGKLVPQGVQGWPLKLSASVPGRIADKAGVQVPTGTDAWAVWQKTVGILGLISWIDQDKVIVTTATNLYTKEDPPVLVWGKNITSLKERRNCAIAGKKIALVAYDPFSGKVVQALYPGVKEETKKKSKAKGAAQKDDYDVFEFNGVTDLAQLMQCAQRVYEERSRQELVGSLVTSEMWTQTASKEQFDLLTLGAGQDIRIELEKEAINGLKDLTSKDTRVDYLMRSAGYSKGAAELVASNVGTLDSRTSTFHTQSVTTTLELDADGGAFTIEIGFCNRIMIE